MFHTKGRWPYWETSPWSEGKEPPSPHWGTAHFPEQHLCDPDFLCPLLFFLLSGISLSLLKASSFSSFHLLLKCHLPGPPYLKFIPSSGSLHPTTSPSSEHLHGC